MRIHYPIDTCKLNVLHDTRLEQTLLILGVFFIFLRGFFWPHSIVPGSMVNEDYQIKWLPRQSVDSLSARRYESGRIFASLLLAAC